MQIVEEVAPAFDKPVEAYSDPLVKNLSAVETPMALENDLHNDEEVKVSDDSDN